MIRPKFFENPAFCEYVRQLVRLHDLIVQATDESPEGDLLRDEMDLTSEDFTDDEILAVNGIAGDIYFLTIDHADVKEIDVETRDSLANAKMLQQSGDLISALAVLRQFRNSIPAAVLALQRGEIYDDAGLHDLAHRFYQFASKYEPHVDASISAKET